MFSNHWQAQIDDIQIDVEIYTVGFGSAGCALFVNDERVDSVPVFGSITQLSLRHNTTTKNKILVLLF